MIDTTYCEMLIELFGERTPIEGCNSLKILRGQLVDLICLDGYSKHQASELLDCAVNGQYLSYETLTVDKYPRAYVLYRGF